MPVDGPYTWDPTVGRYRDFRGRYVAESAIRQALDAEIRQLDREVAVIVQQLREGVLTVDEFEQLLRSIVKDANLLGAAVAVGGWDQLGAADFGRVGRRLRDEYRFLSDFAEAIARQVQPLDGTLLMRAQMYVRGARTLFEAVRKGQQQDVGMDEERSILHPADHCDDCLNEAAAGWQPIGTLIPIGERQCLANCRCTMIYRSGPRARR